MDGKRRTHRLDRICMVLMVATSFSPTFATAAEPVLPAGSSLDPAGFASVILKLAVVLALIVLVGWALRRVQRAGRSASKNLEVIDVLPVGPKERILLVRAADTELLIGMTPGRLSTLHRLDRPASYREVAKLAVTENAA